MPSTESLIWAIARGKKEGAVGTQVADAAMTTWIPMTEADFAETDITYRDDANEINGFQGPTEHQEDSRTGSLARKFTLSADTLADFLTWLLGTDSAAGIADPYTHTITFPTVCTLAPPTFSFVEGLNCAGSTGTYWLSKGCVVESVTIEITGKGAIVSTVAIKTDGSETAKASFTFPASAVTHTKLIGSMVNLKCGSVGTEDLTSILASIKVTVTAGIVAPQRVASSINVTEWQYGDKNPTIAVEFVVKGDKSHALYGYMQNKTNVITTLTIEPGVAPARTITMLMSKAILKVKQGKEGQEPRLTCTLMPEWNSTDSGPAKFTIKTGTAAYLITSP